MSLLEVHNLSIGYETRRGLLRAVEGTSFTVEAGRSLGLVGESGCGKTTLGMALMGLLPPNAKILSGRILFAGQDLLAKDEEQMRAVRWKQIAMIFQAAMNALNPVHRVGDQIAEAILTHSPELGRQEAMERVRRLYELVGLPQERLLDYPHQYSGGMKQRAVIAMAMACRPKLIIADEPTTALDVIVQDQILKEMKRLQREFEVSVIFISHDIAIVAEFCQRIGVMYAGQLVEMGAREEVFENPAHPYTQALLASYPTLTGPRADLRPIPGEAPNLINPPAGCRFAARCPRQSAACRGNACRWVRLSPQHQTSCQACEATARVSGRA